VKLLPSDDPGALVSEVMVGYAADACGLKAGDRIVKVGDTVIDDVESFRQAVAKLDENSVVPFSVERDGAEQELTIRMTPPRDDAPGSKPPTLPAVRDELLAMMEKDQAPRKPLFDGNVTPEEQQKLMEEMKEADAANRQRLKAIIEKHGYPTISAGRSRPAPRRRS
jgi:membrane-associated protease RseP (regulator of RpoE activity)